MPAVKIGDKLPEATVFESPVGYNEESNCPLPPKPAQISELVKGKRCVFVGVPGAFTPTCSAKHVPGYLEALQELKKHGVDEIFVVAVNDGWVMAEWGRSQKADGKLRFIGDGEGHFAKALGVDTVIPSMGLRNGRYSLLVDKEGKIEQFNVESGPKFEVSDAQTMLKQVQK